MAQNFYENIFFLQKNSEEYLFFYQREERNSKGELKMKDMKKTAALLAAMALLGVGSASAAEAAPMYALKGITVMAHCASIVPYKD